MPQFGEKFSAICSEIASQMYIPTIFGWVCEPKQTDTQNTINFLSNNTIKTMKFMRWCCKKKGGQIQQKQPDMSQMVN